MHKCSAYLLIRLHPNIGVPGTAVHWWSLLPDEVCHLNTPSRVPVQTHKHMHRLVLSAQAQCTPLLESERMVHSEKCHASCSDDVLYVICVLTQFRGKLM